MGRGEVKQDMGTRTTTSFSSFDCALAILRTNSYVFDVDEINKGFNDLSKNFSMSPMVIHLNTSLHQYPFG